MLSSSTYREIGKTGSRHDPSQILRELAGWGAAGRRSACMHGKAR
ncbi:hypothetical protein C7S14_7929 [Burkholderia cepacia]|nr:hypothetical protein C7S14_7929 [Burkholderia cepacia]